ERIAISSSLLRATMKAFITGIAGFAGTHLAEHLLAEGDEVLGASLHGSWGEPALVERLPRELVERVPLVAWDITDPDLSAIAARLEAFAPDVIYHLAAVSKASDADSPEGARVNIVGTEHVLELARRLGRPRVVFISSSYVYAQAATPDSPPVPETAPLVPRGGYARRQAISEALVRHPVRDGGDGLIVRAFQHAGPRQSPRFMLAEWCQQFASGASPVEIYNSEAWIDLSDVRDVVRAYRLLAERGAPGEAYNVGSGTAHRT